MVNLDIIKPYIKSLNDTTINYVRAEVDRLGYLGFIVNKYRYLDCTRIVDNMRMMQTIGQPYINEISQFIYAVTNYCDTDEEIDSWLNKLIELHNKNIEFEKVHTPIVYKKEKTKLVKKTSNKPKKEKAAKVTKTIHNKFTFTPILVKP